MKTLTECDFCKKLFTDSELYKFKYKPSLMDSIIFQDDRTCKVICEPCRKKQSKE